MTWRAICSANCRILFHDSGDDDPMLLIKPSSCFYLNELAELNQLVNFHLRVDQSHNVITRLSR